MNEIVPNNSLIIPVDPEHGALRFTMIVLFMGLLVVSYLLISLVIPSESINIIAVLGALALTFVVLQFVEKQLKKRWTSGRAVQITEEGIQVVTKGKVQETIDPQQQVNVLKWHFKIKKRARVPKGWYVVACALEQEGRYLPVYTFMSPKQYEQLEIGKHFPALMSKKDMKGQDAERDLRLAGQQRRLHTAEEFRWNEGAEMSVEDFNLYLGRLQTLFPKWMSPN